MDWEPQWGLDLARSAIALRLHDLQREKQEMIKGAGTSKNPPLPSLVLLILFANVHINKIFFFTFFTHMCTLLQFAPLYPTPSSHRSPPSPFLLLKEAGMFGFSVPGEVTMLTFVVSLTHLRRETLSVEELLPLNSHVDKDVGRFLD